MTFKKKTLWENKNTLVMFPWSNLLCHIIQVQVLLQATRKSSIALQRKPKAD